VDFFSDYRRRGAGPPSRGWAVFTSKPHRKSKGGFTGAMLNGAVVGKFGERALGAKVAVGAAIGGTASVLGGGKFANGAGLRRYLAGTYIEQGALDRLLNA